METEDKEFPCQLFPPLQHHFTTATEFPTITVLQCAGGDDDEASIVAGEFSEAVDSENKEKEEKVVVVSEVAEKLEVFEGHEMEVIEDEVPVEDSVEDGILKLNEEMEGNDKVVITVEVEEGGDAIRDNTEEMNMVEETVTEKETEEGNEAELMKEEEQSRSESGGGKRKRGKNYKSTGKVPYKKKMEENVCFICLDGGELVLCDCRGCPKAYHSTCVNRDEAFFRTKGKWNCGWHLCSSCEKNAHYMCYTCAFSLCKECIKDAVILCVRGNKGFCETCLRTVMLIEQNEQGNMDSDQVDFNDRNSWEYLFKNYYIDLKGRLSLIYDEISQAKNPWRGSEMFPAELESPDDANNDEGSHSDTSSENVYSSTSKRRKAKKRLKSCSKVRDSYSVVTVLGAEGSFADDSSEWASKELLEFVMHMRNGDKSALSQFDVQALLLEYIKRNKLRDPRRKSQIICDARLQILFGKPRVGHFEMLKLLESHFLLHEDFQGEDLQGSVVDIEVSQLEDDGNFDSYLKAGKDKKRRTRRKSDERGLQSNIDDYAAIDNHNINLIYLRRNLVEDLLEDAEKFHDKIVGSFVRIRISGISQKQDLYRLVQVVGACKATEPYKVGKRMTDFLLEILNLNKTEIVSIDIISNQEFTEDECKRLRQSIKCGLINRLTVGDIQDKAMVLQAVRIKDWLETEILRLSHLRDRASEKGHRKEECVEKLQLLKTPEEQQRRLEETPEIHADPKMDPSYESEEDEDEMDDKRSESHMKPRGSAFGKGGREMGSPRGVSISNDSWSGARNYPNLNRELSRNLSNASGALNDAQLLQGRDRESQLSNSWERQKLSSSFESGSRNAQPVVTSDSFSTVVLEASTVPSSTGLASPLMKINETEKVWHYQDPSGKVQGPFSMVQLRKWSNTGYFPSSLKIWRSTESQDEFVLLRDALAGKLSKEPSAVDKIFPKAQMVHDLHYTSPYSSKSHLAAQGIGCEIEGKPPFDQNSGSWNSHSMSSSDPTTGGSWRSKNDMNSFTSRPSPLAVEVPKNPANGWGSDASIRNESTNLPSPTPQTNSGGTKGQAFENEWSPIPVQSANSLLGISLPGGRARLQAPLMVIPVNVLRNADNGSGSQHVMTSGFDMKTAGANVQNLVVNGNPCAEAQGWGSALASRPEPQVWECAPSQRIESNNPATVPTQPSAHGHLGDASSILNTASFGTGNPTGKFSTPGFPGMTAPEPWRPLTLSNQSNITSPAQPNTPRGVVIAENQNAGWGVMPVNSNVNWDGPLPSNVNVNWMPAQVPAPGNAKPGWAASSQGPSPANTVGWGPPGQGHTHANANAGWVVPGQGPAPVTARNPSMWGNEQRNNGDGFQNQGDRGSHTRDSNYKGVKPWNRQSSFNSGVSGGGSSRPPFGGQRGVCKFYESGHCKKGTSCDFLHP